MAVEDKYVPSGLRVVTNNSDLRVLIYYDDGAGMDLSFFVKLTDSEIEGVSFLGGDLGYIYNGITGFFWVNEHGDLFVNDIDVSVYDINYDGDLIQTIV